MSEIKETRVERLQRELAEAVAKQAALDEKKAVAKQKRIEYLQGQLVKIDNERAKLEARWERVANTLAELTTDAEVEESDANTD